MAQIDPAPRRGPHLGMRGMRLLMRAFATAMLLMLCFGNRRVAAQSFVVIVNDGNPTTTISKDQLTKLFLKRVTKWDNGTAAQPVDLPESTPTRDAFTTAVLHRPTAAVRAFWQQQIFSGRGLPPVEKPSESEAVSFVRTNPGAVAYVSATAAQGHGVKILTVE
jgi:ABC-type phosphate transport system substrate-binding protein